MTGDTILSLVRLMQQRPRTAILQTLSVGLPTGDAFARIFQFGLRFTLRCLTAGATWWHGDSCQYWGHNCAIRIKAFATNCNLQTIPLNAHRPQMCHFSHDQIEAALLHRAGYAVQFLPVECGSFEGNPPTLPDFLHRHARWFRGNIENLRFCLYNGFQCVSRAHLIIFASKFVGLAGVCIFALTSALLTVFRIPSPAYASSSALFLYVFCCSMYIFPRVLGIIHAIVSRTKDQRNSARLVASGLIFLVFHVLLAPLAMFSSLKALVSLVLGRGLAWSPHRRHSHIVSWREALALLWLETAIGIALLAVISWVAPDALLPFMPFLIGLILAVPFAVATSSARLGEWLVRSGLCATPEESASTRGLVKN